MKMNLALIMGIALCMSMSPVKADLIWDSGHHDYGEGDETWVYMYTALD